MVKKMIKQILRVTLVNGMFRYFHNEEYVWTLQKWRLIVCSEDGKKRFHYPLSGIAEIFIEEVI